MLRADSHGISSAAAEVDAAADALAAIDVATPFADVSDALVGSATSQACLWFFTRAGAASTVGTASDTVEQQAQSVRASLEEALAGAGGHWAQAAAGRAADEGRTGMQLADALDLAHQAGVIAEAVVLDDR